MLRNAGRLGLYGVLLLLLTAPLSRAQDSSDTINSIHGVHKPAHRKAAPAYRVEKAHRAVTAHAPAAPKRRPVVVTAHRSPAPIHHQTHVVAAPHPVETIVVDSAGKGQFRSLADAIRQARPGAHILVHAGVYTEPLILDKPVEISGASTQYTSIVASADAPCLTVKTDHATVSNMGFRALGEIGVDVPRGSLRMKGCDIAAGTLSGILAHGATARIILQGCQIHGGATNGLAVDDNAQVTLNDCDIGSSGSQAVFAQAGSQVALTECRLHDSVNSLVYLLTGCHVTLTHCQLTNSSRGSCVDASGNTVVTLEDCTAKNAPHDLILLSQAHGTLENCAISGGELSSVVLHDHAVVLLHQCRCFNNKGGGVYLTESSQADLQDCDCHDNALVGLHIDHATATVSGGHYYNNTHEGILFQSGNGTVTNADIGANGSAGAANFALDSSHVAVTQSRIHDSSPGSTAGYWAANGSDGVVSGCDISGNMRANVRLISKANPLFQDCRISGSKVAPEYGDGILLEDGGLGTFVSCDISASPSTAVSLQTDSRVILRGCFIHDTPNGFYIADRAQATVQGCYLWAISTKTYAVMDGGNTILQANHDGPPSQ